MARSVSLGGMILPIALLFIGAYFTFTAVQGNYGLFQRIQIEAEAERLELQLAALQADVARMEVLTGACPTISSISTCSTNRPARCWAMSAPTR